MFYRELFPPDRLRRVIVGFWEFVVPAVAPSGEHEVFPDGCLSVIFVRNLISGVERVGLVGPQTQTVTQPALAGDRVWGMRISPAALAKVLGTDPRSLIDKRVYGSEGCPALLDGLAETLHLVDELENAVGIFAGKLDHLTLMSDPVDLAVAEALRIVEECPGEARVHDLAERLKMSTRQFQRRFKKSSGLTPKQYIRARRIRATAIEIVKERAGSWADRAVDLGFADQSHMHNEVVRMTNRSPNSFAEIVSAIEHGYIIE